jgi:flagellar motor switch protein FliN/FliY
MSDGSLSQDEIDALLQGTGGGGDFSGGGGGGSEGGAVTDAEKENFKSLVGGTAESQKSNFSMLLGKTVTLQAPGADIVDSGDFAGMLSGQVVQVTLDFSEGVSGSHSYVLGQEAALAIASAMMGQEDVELDEAALNALQEAFSQVSGPVITALGEKAGDTVMTSPPNAELVEPDNLTLPNGHFVVLTYRFSIEGDNPVNLYEVYDASVVKATAGESSGAAMASSGQSSQEEDPLASLAGMAQQQPQGGGSAGGGGGSPIQGGGGGGPSVQSVQFPNLQGGGGQQEQGNISLLMDVYMEMTVELGRTKKLIKEILGMGEGTIIELDKLAGEPVDILVNHKLIAKGEVVVIDENFGVRVTEIVSPMERVNNMA